MNCWRWQCGWVIGVVSLGSGLGCQPVKEPLACHFQEPTAQPAWVNGSGMDAESYSAVGSDYIDSAEDYQSSVDKAYSAAVKNLSHTISSQIHDSMTIRARQDGTVDAEKFTQSMSEAALKDIQQSRWLNQESCQIFVQARVLRSKLAEQQAEESAKLLIAVEMDPSLANDVALREVVASGVAGRFKRGSVLAASECRDVDSCLLRAVSRGAGQLLYLQLSRSVKPRSMGSYLGELQMIPSLYQVANRQVVSAAEVVSGGTLSFDKNKINWAQALQRLLDHPLFLKLTQHIE